MKQATFSEQSLQEFRKLAPEEQLRLMENIARVLEENFQSHSVDFTCFQRDGLLLYRYRTDRWRVYFERKEDGDLFCHYILPEHSLSDFVYRFKLPISETLMLEQHSSFWKYLEGLKKKNSNEN
jgi:mRNA interferase RelE/StbE